MLMQEIMMLHNTDILAKTNPAGISQCIANESKAEHKVITKTGTNT